MTDLISRADAIAMCKTSGFLSVEDINALPAAQMMVKPLGWIEYHTDRFYALGINCEYKIHLNRDGSAKWQYKHMGKWQDARSLQDAKGLAQAHCNASIGEWLIGGEA